MHEFNFITTGIGSVPFVDIKETCDLIQELFPDMPFWPQFVKRNLYEDMIIQFSEGLPFEIIKEKRMLAVKRDNNFEKKLLRFYEGFLAEDIDYFSISSEFASGLYEMVERVKAENTRFIKGQSVGPVTFAASVNDEDGKAVVNDPELMDVCVKGIAIKGLWQIKKLKESGKRPVLFFDEPYLSSIGSAFSTISREDVVGILQEVMKYVREREDVTIGIHCCGNTDWSMIIEAGPDIISFDAFNYMEHLLLYQKGLIGFLKGGGALAWGIIPTTDADFEQGRDVGLLFSRLKNALTQIEEWGIDLEVISQNSILTPSCGMGTMGPENAKRALELLSDLSQRFS